MVKPLRNILAYVPIKESQTTVTSQSNDTSVILDHLEPLTLKKTQAKRFTNEIRSLQYLSVGLNFLYRQTSHVENEVSGRIPRDKQVFIYGNAPELRGVPQDLISCFFHWYAVSLCNYVWLVGRIANQAALTNRDADAYAKSVVPGILVWRNKIGAHFAQAKPMPKDKPAELQLSVMYPIAFEDDAFYATPFVLTVKDGAGESTSENIEKWSLTKIHVSLTSRYWP